MPTAIVLSLETLKKAVLPSSHGSLVLAAALDLFLRIDPLLAHTLHDSFEVKPFTVSTLEGNFQNHSHILNLDEGEHYYWRLTGLNEEVSKVLLNFSPELGGVRIGESIFRITDIAFCAEDHPEARQESYEDLVNRMLEQTSGHTNVLKFVTPTTFRHGNMENPFPIPRLVWGSLLERWSRWSDLPPGEAEVHEIVSLLEKSVVLANWKGETRRVELGNRRTVGFIGKFTYRVLNHHTKLCPLMQLLAEYAFYAGVGWQTTHGLGQVRPIY